MGTNSRDMIIELVKAWIDFSVRDGEQTSTEATAQIYELQSHLLQMQSAAASLLDNPDNQDAQSKLATHLNGALGGMGATVIALQFYDRVAQRLQHARQFLDNLDEEGEISQLANMLTMQDERVLFDAVLQGMSRKKAIQLAENSLSDVVSDEDDVELF